MEYKASQMYELHIDWPEDTEQEIIAAMIEGRTASYTQFNEDYGLLSRIDRDIRHEIERRNGNGKNIAKS